jgi:hypothetical protein
MLAYAKADKIDRTDANYDELAGDGFYGTAINNSVILIDVSVRMSFYRRIQMPNGDHTWSLRRIQVLREELRNLLEAMPSHFRVSLMAFSTPGCSNHRNWKNGALTELNAANRADALAFVNSLDTDCGGSRPWTTFDSAFANREARAIYFMSDGTPSLDSSNLRMDYDELYHRAGHYINLNNNLPQKIPFHTIAIGDNIGWAGAISGQTNGTYKWVPDRPYEHYRP